MRGAREVDYYLGIASNDYLFDKGLSLRAKGLLSTMLADGSCHVFELEYLALLGNCGKGAIKTALRELCDHGYLTVKGDASYGRQRDA